MAVEVLNQTDPITPSPAPLQLSQAYDLKLPPPGSLPARSVRPRGVEAAASFRLEIDAARLLFAIAAAICATGPIIWVLVRYWLFAP